VGLGQEVDEGPRGNVQAAVVRLLKALFGRQNPQKTDVDLLWYFVLSGALVTMMLVLGRGAA